MSRAEIHTRNRAPSVVTMVATRVALAFDAWHSVWDETRVWIHHLTGEGPATLQRQREAVAAALASRPLPPRARSRTRRSSPKPALKCLTRATLAYCWQRAS